MGKLYEGGWEVIRAENLEAMWKEKYEDWTKRPRPACPSGSVSAQARRLEIQRPLKMRREVRLLQRMLRKKKRRKKRRRKKRRRRKRKNKQSKVFQKKIKRYQMYLIRQIFLKMKKE